MQPFRKRNSDNLVHCGSPAKKMGEPPEPNDSNKPSIFKALEAVLAAGRRGLLGPAAVEAVEAVPDSFLELCHGKAGQETPRSVPLVEEKKEETKVVNKECDAVVAVMPPVQGIGSKQLTKKEIWICGNIVVSLSSIRANHSSYGLRLGFPPSAAFVYWKCDTSMLWDDLLPFLHQAYFYRPFPSVIVIHVGETDLLSENRCSLVTRMQKDLGILQRAFPNVVIIWSSLLPKQFRKPCKKPRVMESERKNVNCQMEKYCNETDICYLPHPLITTENKSLFSPNNTLSSAGADVFITDLKKIVCAVSGL